MGYFLAPLPGLSVYVSAGLAYRYAQKLARPLRKRAPLPLLCRTAQCISHHTDRCLMCYADGMRTTLELDDDLLSAARHVARQQGVTLGQVISELARQSLAATAPLKVRNGAMLFVPKAHASKPDLRIVNELREEA